MATAKLAYLCPVCTAAAQKAAIKVPELPKVRTDYDLLETHGITRYHCVCDRRRGGQTNRRTHTFADTHPAPAANQEHVVHTEFALL